MALYREFYSVGTNFSKNILRGIIVILSRGTEVRDDNALSFCPFARMRIARSAEAAFAIDPLFIGVRSIDACDTCVRENQGVSESSCHDPPIIS